MELLERIENQMSATGLPLVGITVAAVPCPDTPVILTLHWHGFIREKGGDLPQPELLSYTPVPSSALQLNDRWDDLLAVDRAAMEAGWALGAWDVARAERRGCLRPGAPSTESLECLQAFELLRSEAARGIRIDEERADHIGSGTDRHAYGSRGVAAHGKATRAGLPGGVQHGEHVAERR